MNQTDEQMMAEAIRQSRYGMENGKGGPFGCVIVKDGEIIASGHNEVLVSKDPTAHAEVVAIRKACEHLQSHQLTGCTVYTSCEPCPMCMGAIYWARPDRVFYANTKKDAASIGFDDHFIYEELDKPLAEREMKMIHLKVPEALDVFQDWSLMQHRRMY